MAQAELEEKLSKIRPHKSHKSPVQSAPSKLLSAVEATLLPLHPSGDITPGAYYEALLGLLEKDSESSQQIDDGSTAAAAAYILALVLPELEAGVVKTAVLAVLTSGLTRSLKSAAVVKSFCSCICSVLMDHSVDLSTHISKVAFAQVLNICNDTRPKVRRSAQASVFQVLSEVRPPATSHPYTEETAKTVLALLSTTPHKKSHSNKSKNNKSAPPPDAGAEQAIWTTGFVKLLAPVWPAKMLDPLVTALQALPALSPYLTSSVYALLQSLLALSTEQNSFEPHKISAILDSMLSAPPSIQDSTLSPPWLGAIEAGVVALARDEPQVCQDKIVQIFSVAFERLQSDDQPSRDAACKACCAMIRYGLSNSLILTLYDKAAGADQPAVVKSVISIVSDGFGSIKYRSAVTSMFEIITALLSKLRVRDPANLKDASRKAASILMRNQVKLVGELRNNAKFQYKNQADIVLGMAVEVMGPMEIINLLPLQLELTSDYKIPSNAFLLPLFKEHTTNTNLQHFIEYFVPQSQRLFDLKAAADASEKQMESKIWDTLINQIWACFGGFCDVCLDLKTAFTDDFAGLLINVLYSSPSLRSPILRGLSILLQRNVTLSNSGAPPAEMLNSFGIDQTIAKSNIEHLRRMAPNILAALFNLFSTLSSESKGPVLEVIRVYLPITTPADINNTFSKVTTLLNRNITQQGSNNKTAQANAVTEAGTMLDLLIILIPFLSTKDAKVLSAIANNPVLLDGKDASQQKKCYRILTRMAEVGKFGSDQASLTACLGHLLANSTFVANGAKKDRLLLFIELVKRIPSNSLHLIISMLSEAVLGVKEANTRTREVAFDLIIVMAEKMKAGGTIDRNMLEEGVSSSIDNSVQATVQEFVTIIAAGLAGSTPHFIGASLLALGRVLFEYQDELNNSLNTEILETLPVFITSTNREIVRAALGLTKIVILVEPTSSLKTHLHALVPALLAWSNDHKNQFKSKVRHIIERLIRKCGFEDMEKHTPDKDQKLLVNIRKRRERAKRGKTFSKEDEASESDDASAAPKERRVNAFEDALYGSDSDGSNDGASENETEAPLATNKRDKRSGLGKTKTRRVVPDGPVIVEDENELVDLMDRTVVSKLSMQKPGQSQSSRKPGHYLDKMEVDEETGKMIIRDEDKTLKHDLSKETAVDPTSNKALGATAYHESMISTDGFKTDSRGKVKFNKSTKRSRAAEAADEVMAELESGEKTEKRPKKAPKAAKTQIGSEFKAKKAAGDIHKKGEIQPYAYLPLGNQKKTKTFSITGKKRNSAS